MFKQIDKCCYRWRIYKRMYGEVESVRLCAQVNDDSEVWKKSSLKLLAAYQDPPNAHLSIKYVARKAEEREYVHRQFKKCQEQVGMDPNMLFFSETYEPNFVKFMNKINVMRVRITFTIGGCASALLFWYEADRLKLYDADSRDISTEAEHVLYILTIGIVLMFFAGVGLSFFPYMQQRLERSLGFGVYWLVATAFITKKWVQQQLGPILPLVILLIPIFNVTRMRFAYNCVLGWYIVITYFIVQLIAGPDETSAIVFQSLNYSMSVISGMVSSYQREILKRRNYTLRLPLQGTVSDVVSLIHDPHYLKEYLCHPISQRFRCDDLERYFYRYWYLLDRSPYENPNAGVLHLGVYLGIKFATIGDTKLHMPESLTTSLGVFVNQITLSLQDVLNLYGNTLINYTVSIRYCLIVPAYALQYCLFYYYGQLYANMWRKKREIIPKDAHKSPKRAMKHVVDNNEDTGILSMVAKTKAVLNQTKDEIGQRAFDVADLQQEVVKKVTNTIKQQVVKVKEGYTRSAQFTTLSVFMFHVSLNGVFIYSSLGTTALSIAFIVSLYNWAYARFTEYTSYVLGIIISYEEENLRR
ncbi:hypothetical protein THRCLA_05154 [Thraustotheca clavata]|uniref:Transmembrane protein n=1 Tax=Thraustotheca clavata TaxID=74557 RepID=A0A1V9ZWS4_9STRA|nr:hypothetical protein THRCLA_05154 [Thraustotheca clavata]